ncbi:MAG: hypothetical protein SGJ05_03675 [bacterium]|nr:hypothetical protein [bacterium]
MRVLTVHEYSRIRISDGGEADSITPYQARVLETINERFRSDHKDELFDWYRSNVIRIRNYVGVVQIGDLVLEILPKIHKDDVQQGSGREWAAQKGSERDRAYLLHMLRESGTLPLTTRDITHFATQRMTLLELVLHLYAEEARKQLHKGRVHRYQHTEEIRSTIRGKLLVGEHARSGPIKQLRFPCRYTEFTADTPLNRLMRTAAKQGLRIASNASVRQSLSWVELQFDDVQLLQRPFTSNIPTIHFDRNNQRFEQACNLAVRILRSLAPDVRAGQTDYTSMLFNMNELFEKYIARILRRQYHGVTTFREQGPWSHLYNREDGKAFRMIPDIVLGWADEKFDTTIVDTKWKLLDNRDPVKFGVGQADAYQMFAYKHRYDAKRVILLYPHHDGLTTPAGRQAIYQLPSDTSRTLEVWTVDVQARELRI